MKRAVLIILGIVVVAMIAGCQGVPMPQTVEVIKTVEVEVQKEKPKLAIWKFDGVLPEVDQWYEKVIYQYAAENDVEVEIFHAPEEAYFKKVTAAIETGQLPDVWMTWESYVPGYLKAGVIADVSDVMAELDQNAGGLVDGIIPAMTYDGKQWAIPWQVWADALYVRKDLLEAKGLQPPTTFEEVVEVAKAVADPTMPIYGWGMHLGNSADSNAEMHTLIWSYGGSVWGEDGKTVVLDSPETIQALQLVKDAWDAGAMSPDSPNWDSAGNNQCYLTEVCAMVTNAGSVYVAMRDGDPELLEKTLILPDPAGPADQLNFTNYEPWVMSASSQNPEEAKKFLKWLYDPERQLEYMQLQKGFNFPIYKDHANDPMWDDPYLKPFLENSARSRTGGYPGPNSAWVQEGLSQLLLPKMMTRILIDNVPIETAVADTVKQLEDIRDSFNPGQ